MMTPRMAIAPCAALIGMSTLNAWLVIAEASSRWWVPVQVVACLVALGLIFRAHRVAWR